MGRITKGVKDEGRGMDSLRCGSGSLSLRG